MYYIKRPHLCGAFLFLKQRVQYLPLSMNSAETNKGLLSSIKDVILTARQNAYKSNNVLLLNMYWQIGRLIVEDEQEGKTKAAYGKAVLKNISHHLTLEFGKGFDESNLRNIRQFYLAFPIRDAVRHELEKVSLLWQDNNTSLRILPTFILIWFFTITI